MPILDVVLRLSLSVLFGGVVGFEREHKSRPAGLRTHILVCIGAALVQIIAFSYYKEYRGKVSADPMRLGAQVISGIGFLGAGTIMKEGVNIRGLTTAATLWVVACIGLAVGSGFYLESLIATAFVYISLEGFRRFENPLKKDGSSLSLKLTIINQPGIIGEIGNMLGKLQINIIYIETYKQNDDIMVVDLIIGLNKKIPKESVTEILTQIKGVKDVEF